MSRLFDSASGRLDDMKLGSDEAVRQESSCSGKVLNPCMTVKTKLKQKQNVVVDPFSSSTLPSSEDKERSDFSIYLRLYVLGLDRGAWYRFRFHNGKHICMDDDGMKNGVVSITLGENDDWHSSLAVLDNRVYKNGGPTDILVLDTKQVDTTATSNYLLTWNKTPSTKIPRDVPLITSLNRSIYVINDNRGLPPEDCKYHDDGWGPSDFCEILDHGWGEVLRPQSNEWELLSSPPPRFDPESYIFFHGVDELDKLVIGSLEESLLYLYDAKTKELEKVENLTGPCTHYNSDDTIVVGKYLIWCRAGGVYMYDLVEKKFLHRLTIEGIPASVSNTVAETRTLHLGGDRFCYIVLKDIEHERNSYLHLFEFSLGGEPPYGSSFRPRVTSYFKYTLEKCCHIMNAILLMDY